jgi:hypothetical protein
MPLLLKKFKRNLILKGLLPSSDQNPFTLFIALSAFRSWEGALSKDSGGRL